MREFLENTKTNGFSLWVILCILITTFFFIFVLYSPSSSTISTQIQFHPTHSPFHDPPIKDKYRKCDLFKGEWVKDPKEPPYTNATCPTIPTTKDCFLHGRKDKDFLYWRWKPEKCELPRFEPETFLKIMNNKKLAFIGDSIARNQIDSLICLLTQQESPIDVYKDAKDRSRVWFFPKSNFTLMVLWTRFLVKGVEKEGGVFDLHLDQVDEKWGYNVSQGEVDYAIVSSVQWYFKKHFLYEKGDLIGCLNCGGDDHLIEFSVSFAVKKAFQTAFRYINGCKACKDMVTIARTISPSHFEHGTWRTGGDCERSKPYNEAQLKHLMATHNKSSIEWQVRNLQMEEIEHAMNEGRSRSQKFKAMDITKIMLVRPDGHPGPYWRDKKKKFNDCVHWCMPGPIDVWNDLLLALLLD